MIMTSQSKLMRKWSYLTLCCPAACAPVSGHRNQQKNGSSTMRHSNHKGRRPTNTVFGIFRARNKSRPLARARTRAHNPLRFYVQFKFNKSSFQIKMKRRPTTLMIMIMIFRRHTLWRPCCQMPCRSVDCRSPTFALKPTSENGQTKEVSYFLYI